MWKDPRQKGAYYALPRTCLASLRTVLLSARVVLPEPESTTVQVADADSDTEPLEEASIEEHDEGDFLEDFPDDTKVRGGIFDAGRSLTIGVKLGLGVGARPHWLSREPASPAVCTPPAAAMLAAELRLVSRPGGLPPTKKSGGARHV